MEDVDRCLAEVRQSSAEPASMEAAETRFAEASLNMSEKQQQEIQRTQEAVGSGLDIGFLLSGPGTFFQPFSSE